MLKNKRRKKLFREKNNDNGFCRRQKWKQNLFCQKYKESKKKLKSDKWKEKQ